MNDFSKKGEDESSKKESEGNGWVPIYIRLQKYAGQSSDEQLENSIQDTLSSDYGLSQRDIQQLKQQKNGHQHAKLLAIMDGYDEIGPQRFINISRQISQFGPHAKILVICRTEHFSTSSPPPSQVFGSDHDIVYLSPFDRNDIKTYCQQFDEKQQNKLHQQQTTERTFKRLKKMTGLMELLSNPFVLVSVLQSVDQLEINRTKYNRKAGVLRYEVYEAFIETWIYNEIQGFDISVDSCFQLCHSISRHLFDKKELIIKENEVLTSGHTETEKLILQMLPIRWLTANEGTFVHKSVFEFLVSRLFIQQLQSGTSTDLWESRVLSEDERSVMLFVADYVRLTRTGNCWVDLKTNHSLSQDLQSRLIQMVLDSRENFQVGFEIRDGEKERK